MATMPCAAARKQVQILPPEGCWEGKTLNPVHCSTTTRHPCSADHSRVWRFAKNKVAAGAAHRAFVRALNTAAQAWEARAWRYNGPGSARGSTEGQTLEPPGADVKPTERDILSLQGVLEAVGA